MSELKPPIASQQCVVYNYKCDLCDAEYVSSTPPCIYTERTPLFSNRQPFKEQPRSGNDRRTYQQLFRFKKVQRKNSIYEMLFLKKKRPCLHTQSDSYTRETINLNPSQFSCTFLIRNA